MIVLPMFFNQNLKNFQTPKETHVANCTVNFLKKGCFSDYKATIIFKTYKYFMHYLKN